MYRPLRPLVPGAILLVLGLTVEQCDRQAFGGQADEKPILRPPELLATTVYELDGRRHWLGLWTKKLVPAPNAVAWRENRRPIDAAFMIIDGDAGRPRTGKVVWITYGTIDLLSPQIGFTLVWHPQRKRAFLVALHGRSGDALLRVYEVNLKRCIGAYPLALNVKEMEEWPEEDKPLSVAERSVPLGRRKPLPAFPYWGCKIIGSIQEDDLCIAAERSDGPAFFRFKLGSKQWSDWVIDED